MSEVFACPHCQNQFPALPCLVGRKVRCSSCSKVFMLQADGIAIAVQPGGTAPVNKPAAAPADGDDQASMPAPPAKPDPVAKPATAKPASASSSKLASESGEPFDVTPEPGNSKRVSASDEDLRQLTRTWVEGDTMATKRRSAKRQTAESLGKPQRITSRAEALRKSLRSNLQAAAAQAAASVGGQAGVELELDLDDKDGIERRLSGSVRLSGEGKRRAKSRMISLGVLAGLVIACLLMVGVLGGSDPMVERLERYADGNGGRASIADRRARAWFSTCDGVVSPLLLADPGDVTVHPAQRYTLEALQLLANDKLTGFVPYDELACFVAADDQPTLRALREETGSGFLALEAARGSGYDIDLISYEECVEVLRGAGANGDLLHYLSQGLAGEAEREPSLRQRWLSGDLPVACDVVILRGRNGMELRPEGREVRARALPDYTAIMVRFLGAGWDTEWRVFDCYASEDPAHLENALEVRTRVARYTGG